MATAKRFNENGEGQSEVTLPDDLFGGEVHRQALYEYVKTYLTNQRQGTSKTKERNEVAYSTAKLYRQKGTGRARSGSAKSPVRVGGGTIFGPKPRSFRTELNRRVKRLALRSALADRANLGSVYVVETPTLDAPKTKHTVTMLNNMGLRGKTILFVTKDSDPILYRSLRNVKGVDVVPAYRLNAYEVLRSDNLVFTDDSLQRVVEVFGK